MISAKSLTQLGCATQQSSQNLLMLPFRFLLQFVSTYLCEQGLILGETNEKQSPQVLTL